MTLFLASAGAIGAAGAWTFLIKVFINLWKRSLFGGIIEVGADVGFRVRALGLGVEGFIAGFLCQTGGIMMVKWSKARTKRRVKTKEEELPCLPNSLTKLLDKSF